MVVFPFPHTHTQVKCSCKGHFEVNDCPSENESGIVIAYILQFFELLCLKSAYGLISEQQETRSISYMDWNELAKAIMT